MKNGFTSIATVVFMLSAHLSGVVIETARFADIEKYVTPATLVVLDIDDTLLLPVQALGNDVWFQYRVKQNEKTATSFAEAFDKSLGEWEALRHLTQVKIVEEGTAEVVAGLQNRGIKIMGLTTQGAGLTARTLKQLLTLGIDLKKTAPYPEDYYFMNGAEGVLYREGLLSTAGTAKGEALIKLLKQANMHPAHVLFINDKATHISDVEKTVEANGVTFTGLRYSYSDARLAAYDPELTDIQWEYSTFGRILSDEEALIILEKRQSREVLDL